MLPGYDDIRALTDRDPDWFDGNGVPRYAPFEPPMLGVYDRTAILVRIECQACQQSFLVGEGRHPMNDFVNGKRLHMDMETWVRRYHYGDPPIHGCVGDTMNSVPVEIVEAWEQRSDKGTPWPKWQRVPAVEGPAVDSCWHTNDAPADTPDRTPTRYLCIRDYGHDGPHRASNGHEWANDDE